MQQRIERDTRGLDPLLLLVSVALAVYGLALIYSGSLARFDSPAAVLRGPIAKQALFLALGLALALALARFDYRGWRAVAPLAYALGLGLLAAVLLVGASEYGSRRWIALGGFQFQPSEPAKLATILLLARLFAAAGGRAVPARTFALTLALAVGPAVLVFKEPDLGTAVVFLTVWLGMGYMAGARLRHLALLAGLALAALPFVMLVAVHGYQKERLAAFFNPNYDPLGAGYNANQAAISIGSGGWLGKGWTKGPQTQLAFLRTQTTDYIFSVLGEELGFVGAMLLFALFLILLLRGLQVAALAPDDFGRLLATGIVVMLLTQVGINVGVNIRLFPVTGIPLPFISQGGSSLLSVFASVGLLQS
ncbi:MAG: rod shape-determining protein RodA, partial [Chloroflexota bacterium]